MGPENTDAAKPSTVAPERDCPAHIGPYEIDRELGRGGMGVVYLGRDTRLGRPVAIKLLPGDLADNADRRARFEREARTAARLNHPNIATIYELGESERGYFISMEFVDGCTLGEHLVGTEGVSLPGLLEIAEQIAAGLAAAHACNVVHRDLKPDNVMITRDRRVKILDFGLAKALEPEPAASAPTALTEPGGLLGTVDYMSPEQARGRGLDVRSDLFSFGAVLYEMATGTSPFHRPTIADTLSVILTEEPDLVSAHNAGVPEDLVRVISKLLKKEPEQRYQTAEEVLADLRDVRRRLEGGQAAIVSAGAGQTESIAVLPFADISPGRDQEYFCDGLAEELINALTQVEGLHVVARTSAFQFKDKNLDVRTMGQQLNVDTVLEGSVRKAGNRLRITAQLVKVSDGYHLWSQRYDRNLEDVFAVQDEIARTIVGTFKVKLAGERELVRRYTDNVAAYSLYLKGRHFWDKRLKSYLLKGIECFEAAIENDPEYALAYAGLADSYSILGSYVFIPPREAYVKALEAAERATKLDDSLAEGHSALGLVKFWYVWDFETAESEMKRAIELNPKLADTYGWYAHLLAATLRLDEALRWVKRAKELDPLSPALAALAGFVLSWAGRFEEASREAQTALEIAPNHLTATYLLCATYICRSMYEEAVGTAKKAVELTDRAPFTLSWLGTAYAAAGREKEARRIAEELSARKEYVPTAMVAILYSLLSDNDKAFEWLERAIEQRNSLVPYLKVLPEFANLRNDPRFDDVARRIGLPA